jgi:hypothetical protein
VTCRRFNRATYSSRDESASRWDFYRITVKRFVTLVPLDRPWLPLSKTPIINPKKRTVQDTAFKRGLKLSNSKPGCRVTALHFFVKYILPMTFWHRAHSDKCFFPAP